jgi:cytochrome P450
VFARPDEFDPTRGPARRHIAFAHGPHVCVGIHLARPEARLAMSSVLSRFEDLRLDERRPAAARGLVFRKPPALHVRCS